LRESAQEGFTEQPAECAKRGQAFVDLSARRIDKKQEWAQLVPRSLKQGAHRAGLCHAKGSTRAARVGSSNPYRLTLETTTADDQRGSSIAVT
jgi:hypothetical protein